MKSNSLSETKVIAVIGAGGKTTLCRALTACLPGKRVYLTTTHMYRPEADFFCLENPGTDALGRALDQYGAVGLCGAPAEPQSAKVGPPHEEADRAARRLCDHVIVEADGARGRLIKLHGKHEPVIPADAGLVLCCASLQALGRPLGEVVHRAERIGEVYGRDPGSPVTPADIALALALPKTTGTPYVPVINQVSDFGSATEVQEILLRQYGLRGVILPLLGSRDRLVFEDLEQIFAGLDEGLKDWH